MLAHYPLFETLPTVRPAKAPRQRYTVVYEGAAGREKDTLARLLKLEGRSFDMRCIKAVKGDWLTDDVLSKGHLTDRHAEGISGT